MSTNDGFRGWPDGAKAAVSLTFDDAPPSQLDYAIPILDRSGLRGTFYVNPGPGGRFAQAVDRWRAAHDRGHEIGNHTLRHPCSGNFPWVPRDRALEVWTLEDVEQDVLAARDHLCELLPGIGELSFAYPCGQTFVGRGAARQSYVPVIARHFSVARGLGESANDPSMCDLHCLSSWMVEGLSAEALIGMLQPAVELGHWATFCFHGVGGDHIAVTSEAFAGLVDFLAERKDEIWTDSVMAVGSWVGGA